MDNLALQIIDEVIGQDSTEEKGFIIENDAQAEWALKKIAEEKAEAQRYINVCETMILEYESKIQYTNEQLDNKTAYLKEQLRKYFETVDHKKTKTQESYKLPSGTLKLKQKNPEYKRDDDKLIEWLKTNEDSFADMVKTKESVDWARLKKCLTISGNKVVDVDGSIVEGIEVIERSPEFIVEV